MRLLFSSLILVLISCAPKQDKIIIPVLNNDFYSQALLRIDDGLEKDEDNLKLVEQKLYYCDLLNWPGTCHTALDEIRRQKGMTPQLLDQYITFYTQHNEYQSLLNVINRWSPEFGLEDDYLEQKILSLVKTGKKEEASNHLRSFMINNQTVNHIKFASACYLEVGDTLMASYYLGKLSEISPMDELVLNVYPYLLLDVGSEDRAFEILERKSSLYPNDYPFHRDLAEWYERSGRFLEASNKLKNFVEIDSVIYKIADLYLIADQWDSAHQYIDILIARDSLDRNAWYTKAKMYEDRGWLSYSLNYYDHVIYLNPNDSIAIQRAALVRQKIAYLQRLKFEENQLPLPVLKSKRIINNE